MCSMFSRERIIHFWFLPSIPLLMTSKEGTLSLFVIPFILKLNSTQELLPLTVHISYKIKLIYALFYNIRNSDLKFKLCLILLLLLFGWLYWSENPIWPFPSSLLSVLANTLPPALLSSWIPTFVSVLSPCDNTLMKLIFIFPSPPETSSIRKTRTLLPASTLIPNFLVLLADANIFSDLHFGDDTQQIFSTFF